MFLSGADHCCVTTSWITGTRIVSPVWQGKWTESPPLPSAPAKSSASWERPPYRLHEVLYQLNTSFQQFNTVFYLLKKTKLIISRSDQKTWRPDPPDGPTFDSSSKQIRHRKYVTNISDLDWLYYFVCLQICWLHLLILFILLTICTHTLNTKNNKWPSECTPSLTRKS